jgi:hypothetical protein
MLFLLKLELQMQYCRCECSCFNSRFSTSCLLGFRDHELMIRNVVCVFSCKIENEPAVVRQMQTKLLLGPHC